jgi:hypothetical protein
MVKKSEHIYIIYAKRNSSQFGQRIQEMRCRVLDAHADYALVESMKRYNRRYAGASRTRSGLYKGMPVRRINKDQILKIIDETANMEVKWETMRRREGTQNTPGRARGGK